MAVADFLAVNFWYMVLAVFLIGTALLWKTKLQRFYIIFLIKTKHGIKWLDRVGSISPGMWKSLADLSLVISFGGLGAAYVSRYRRPYPFFLVLGMIALFLQFQIIGELNAGVMFILLLAAVFAAHKFNSRVGYFILGSVIIFSLMFGFVGGLKGDVAGIAVSAITGVVGIPGLIISFLGVQASNIVLQESTLPGISPLLPGLSSGGEIGFVFPGLDIFIPLWSGLIALIFLLVSHEFSHGILARIQGIRIKSMGIVTFGPIPIGAFVEPDEKHLESRRSEEKMRVYSMGSFANLMVAFISTILIMAISIYAVAPMIDAVGVKIESVQEGFPAEVLEPGTVITSINSVPVSTLEEYIGNSSKFEPGDLITLGTDRGEFTLESVESPDNPSKAYLGFMLSTETDLKPEFAGQGAWLGFLLAFLSLLGVMFFFNLNIALVNLLPVLPFDGFKMFEELMKSFNLKKVIRKKIINFIVVLVVVLLLLNALPLGGVITSALGI